MFAKCAPQAHEFRLRDIGSGGQFITPAIASQRKESCLSGKNPTLPINWPHTHTNTVTFARAASTVQCPQGILCAQNLDLGVIKSTRTQQRLMRPNPRILSRNVLADTKNHCRYQARYSSALQKPKKPERAKMGDYNSGRDFLRVVMVDGEAINIRTNNIEFLWSMVGRAHKVSITNPVKSSSNAILAR